FAVAGGFGFARLLAAAGLLTTGFLGDAIGSPPPREGEASDSNEGSPWSEISRPGPLEAGLVSRKSTHVFI
ncbi:MAG TPA: hypothetical protein VIX73_33065, partial [Kofleriaceae bacterium]